jgi:hypothetical protein
MAVLGFSARHGRLWCRFTTKSAVAVIVATEDLAKATLEMT